MTQIISESVTVGMSDSLKWVKRRGRIYKIDTVGYHHTVREGKTLFHIFSVTSNTLFMKLIFNTESLSWKLEEISDLYT
jgi:hypothetical protein